MQSITHNKRPVVLSCRHLKKSFGNTDVLKDITFSIRRGERVGVVGPNGSGKSTLFMLLANLLEADSGTVNYGKGVIRAYLPQVHEEEELSGGEVARKVLKPIMDSKADIFLLDEPTNNLDVSGLEMVEKFVNESSSAFLIISHDRMFLDHTVSKIIELDQYSKTAYVYEGNYSSYIEERDARIERSWSKYNDSQEKTQKLSREVDQRLSWMKKIEQKRLSIRKFHKNENDKPVAAILRDKEAKAGRRARLIKDRLEAHIEKTSSTIEKPVRELPLRINFEPARGSTKVFDLVQVTKKAGAKVIGPVNTRIQYGDRVHITGENGAGKSTLLKIILGELSPDTGEIIRGENVHIGYIEQSKNEGASDQTALEHFIGKAELDQTNARKILNRFRISAEDVKKEVGQLSPGEYSRLVISELVALQPNCIILDEPSNHLDLEVLEELEGGLMDFLGTLIVVSHDRYFVEKISLSKEIAL
jgi:macrolide transport system ATP-binding/permease protein